MNIDFERIKYKNIMSVGNTPVDIDLTKRKTLITGKNGGGKCLDPLTEIDVDFLDDDVRNKFLQFLNS